MNINNKSLLESEIIRFNKIMAYQDKLHLNEVSYRFYNESEEDEPTDNQEVNPEPSLDNDGLDAIEPETTPEMGGDDIQPDMGDEGDGEVEIDVTDLVNSTKDIQMKTQDAVSKVDNITQKMDSLISKIGTLETNVNKMDQLINQLESLRNQVELMRPPTEEERRKALAKDSYPFSVTMDDYQKGAAIKTQTDLENTSKMSMMDILMSDYDVNTIKKSF